MKFYETKKYNVISDTYNTDINVGVGMLPIWGQWYTWWEREDQWRAQRGLNFYLQHFIQQDMAKCWPVKLGEQE